MTAARLSPVFCGLGALLLAIPLAALARPEGVMSDSIAERVIAAWGKQPAGIIVKVDDGVVEMWGEAPSAAAAAAAVQIARNTAGVREVVSHLSVNSPDQPRQTAAAR